MMQLTEEEWQKKLTPEQYRVLRQKGTEAPFSGELLNMSEKGVNRCAACGAELFKSDAKFESKLPGLRGWPSFSDVAKAGTVTLQPDTSLGMRRTEAVCANCGSHLGHVFEDADDAPEGGMHYCINSCALDFSPEELGVTAEHGGKAPS